MAPGAELEIDIAAKRFGAGPPLLAGFRLRVAAGSCVCLLGPSGIGKTTLLRMIAGIDRGFEGRILIDGLGPAEAPVPGFVFQDPRLLPWATATGNLLAVHPGVSREAARERLASVGLATFEEALPRELSGGMQRRVALARALLARPRLLLLDEPFVSLDRPLVRELQALVLAIAAAERPTILIVSHDPEDAARLADRAILLAGRPARIAEDQSLAPPPVARSEPEVAALARSLSAMTGAPA
jgi:NitT/TauT family transport system ATP-binding protein/sulfonate transport system ATP-binding protein